MTIHTISLSDEQIDTIRTALHGRIATIEDIISSGCNPDDGYLLDEEVGVQLEDERMALQDCLADIVANNGTHSADCLCSGCVGHIGNTPE